MSQNLIDQIARIRHLCWVCFQMGAGQPHNLTPYPDQLESLKNGVMFALSHPKMSPEENHINWMKMKTSQGWKYGPVKDLAKKEHPDLVPFADLPKIEQLKDIMDKITTEVILKILTGGGEGG